ncbi:hypothetical protein KHQ81_05020 [Mycoplasmatota bacterium]|nr:hypothetical protein KHQ81_05020 [Mycoplasmatota bacterium]
MKGKKIIFFCILLVSVSYLIGSFIICGFNTMPIMYHHYYRKTFNYWYLPNNIFIWLGLVSIIILLILSSYSKKERKALEILEKRLSTGEISIEEFKEISKELKK